MVSLLNEPTTAKHAATKQYVDGATTGAIKAIRIQGFSGSVTYTPHANMTYAMIECIGGGGAGGGAVGAVGQFLCPGGGGSGGYSRKLVTKAQVGASQAITIGAGGVGVLGSAGGAGGNTSFGSLCIAYGGGGGLSYSFGGGAASPAGIGDFVIGGSPGSAGITNYAIGTIGVFNWGGNGASGPFGGGGQSGQANSGGAVHGNSASGYGSGGGAANAHNVAVDVQGGNGWGGLCIITEFCSA